MSFDSVVDELYALPLGEFTAARNAAARDAGDRVLAARIKTLPRPSVAAWVANLLARTHPDAVAELVSLGATLRDVSLGGSELRQLTEQRYRVVAALVETARRAALEAGQAVTPATAEAVQRTLNAALADPDAADLLAAGRLSAALDPAGFGVPSGELAEVVPIRRAAPDGPAPRAGRAVAAAREDLREAERRLKAARQSSGQAGRDAARLADRIAALREQLAELSAEHAGATRTERQARGALRRAERAVADARRALDRAQSRS